MRRIRSYKGAGDAEALIPSNPTMRLLISRRFAPAERRNNPPRGD
jgi:hypothetical protein